MISLESGHLSPLSVFFGLCNSTTPGLLCGSGFQKSKQGSGYVLLPGALCHPWRKTKSCPGAVLGCNSAAAWFLPCQSTMAQFSSVAPKINSDLVPSVGLAPTAQQHVG